VRGTEWCADPNSIDEALLSLNFLLFTLCSEASPEDLKIIWALSDLIDQSFRLVMLKSFENFIPGELPAAHSFPNGTVFEELSGGDTEEMGLHMRVDLCLSSFFESFVLSFDDSLLETIELGLIDDTFGKKSDKGGYWTSHIDSFRLLVIGGWL
jgi:hypothetical protein